MRFGFILVLIISILFTGCRHKDKNQLKFRKKDQKIEVNAYAEIFELIHCKGYSLLHLKDPWRKGGFYGKYILIPRNIELPVGLPPEYQVIRTPVERFACMASTNVAMLAALKNISRIAGVTNPDKIFNEEVYSLYQRGKINHIGDDFTPKFEQVISCSPEVILKNGYNQSLQNDEVFLKSGIPVFYNLEWMENTALGRAEWIKVLGEMTNKRTLADSIFNKVKSNYDSLKKVALSGKHTPKILLSSNYKGTWYLPGGKSYYARMLKEAKGDYCYSNDSSSGSIPLSFEVVLDKLLNAGVWIDESVHSFSELKNQDVRYTYFRAYREKQVYGRCARVNSRGANDYWETGVVRPDLTLADLIKILHPELLPGYKLFFHKKLE
ncbi:MAG: ABC transporter substrate-binding protein [Bacteroidota bacterium]|nr:ABC transporter substrate-binding protein [Bacteroidota bacterium]MDP4205425.1 ABC transporter substrate-binding protein [Bacteroidota bacterium]